MATIETVRPSIYGKSFDEVMGVIRIYRERRLKMLETPDVDMNADLKMGRRSSAKSKVAVAPEIKALAKTLGISVKRLMALREE